MAFEGYIYSWHTHGNNIRSRYCCFCVLAFMQNVMSVYKFSVMIDSHLQCGSHIFSVTYAKYVYTDMVIETWYTCMYTHTYMHKYILMYTCLLTHMCVSLYTCVYEYIHIRMHTYIYIQSCLLSYIHFYMNTTYMPTNKHNIRI